jgi:hypothetical protein
MGCSESLTGILNFVTLVLSLPIIAVGIWLAKQHNTVCYHFLEWPVIIIGGIILVVSLVGMLGAWCKCDPLLVLYLIAMFLLIASLFIFTIFAFVVTNAGGGDAVPGKGFQVPRFLLLCLSVSLSLSVYSQKAKLKIKSAKIKCLLRFSIAKIRPKF